ncbi:MAG: hypothetical protein ACK48B_04155, partial [Dolichospermum sp.]
SKIYPQISLEDIEISVKTKKRRKNDFMVLTKNFEYVMLILIRKNYLHKTYAKYLSNPHFSVTSVPGVVRYSMNLA